MNLTKHSGRVDFSSWEGFILSVQRRFVSYQIEILNGKHFIGLVTICFTVAVIPLFRLVSQRNSNNQSKAADAGISVLANILGIGIIIYPWWLATAKSPLYYNRLQLCGKLIGSFIILFTGIQGIFTPEQPFDKNHPNQTTLSYKIVSTLTFISTYIGLLIILPIYIRRERLFKSNSQALFRFAWLFTMIMLVGLLMRRWTGYTRIVSFSCLFVVIQFFVFNYLEEIERRRVGKTAIFDEAYIIIAGFVPYWLAFAVGATLLEIVSQSGAVGTVFVYIAWRIVIYALEYMASEVGRKASRFSDGSVFSFSAIYTGATFANFIFLSVQFNSPTFWALLIVTMLNIIIIQGGIMIDIDYIFMDYIAIYDHPWLNSLKIWYFEFFRVMPHNIAIKIINSCKNPTPEIQLVLIRGRATVLQINWTHNDIKMSSEFQGLACACTAVAMEIACTYLNIGSDSITAKLSDRRGVLYIYCVNILFIYIAQYIARRRLRHKVAKLKKEISATIKALEGSSHNNTTLTTSRPRSVSNTTTGNGGSRRASTSSAASMTSATSARSRRRRSVATSRRGSATLFSSLAAMFRISPDHTPHSRNPKHGHHGLAPVSGRDLEQAMTTTEEVEAEVDGRDDEYESDEGSSGTEEPLIPEQEEDTDALNAILGLCKLYETEDMIEMEKASKPGNKRQSTGVSGATSPSNRESQSKKPFFQGRWTRQGIELDATSSQNEINKADTAGGDPSTTTNTTGTTTTVGAIRARFGRIRFVRNRSNKLSYGDLANHESTENNNSSSGDSDDGWDEVQLTSRTSQYHTRSSINKNKERMQQNYNNNNTNNTISSLFNPIERRKSTGLTNIIRMQGYLNKRKPNTIAEYQRRFFVLTDRQLMYFEKEEDVEMHINRRKGAINIADMTNIDRYDPTSMCIINITVKTGRIYIMLAADRNYADEWYDMIQEVREHYKATQTKKASNTVAMNLSQGDTNNDLEGGNVARATMSSRPSLVPWLVNRSGESQQNLTEHRQTSLRFGLGGLAAVLGFDGGEDEDSPAFGGSSNSGVTDMIRRGTTTARRGLGSIYYGTTSSAYHNNTTTTDKDTEIWKHTWDVSHLPRKMGYLQKKGELNSAWQQRWFVLDTAGNLSWYEKAGYERTQQPKGRVSIGELVCILPTKLDTPRNIEIKHIHGRIYELESSSEIDAEDWRRILTLWIESAQEAIDRYNQEHIEPYIVNAGYLSASYDQDAEEKDENNQQITYSSTSTEYINPTNQTTTNPNNPNRKTGFMLKRGGLNSAFKRRYFVLDYPGILTWYEKEKHVDRKDKQKGSLQLSDVICIKLPREDAFNLIELKHLLGRTYEFETTTTLEAEEWRDALNIWLKFAYTHANMIKVSTKASKQPVSTDNNTNITTTTTAPIAKMIDTLQPTEPSLLADADQKTSAIQQRYMIFSKPSFNLHNNSSSRKADKEIMNITALSDRKNSFGECMKDESMNETEMTSIANIEQNPPPSSIISSPSRKNTTKRRVFWEVDEEQGQDENHENHINSCMDNPQPSEQTEPVVTFTDLYGPPDAMKLGLVEAVSSPLSGAPAGSDSPVAAPFGGLLRAHSPAIIQRKARTVSDTPTSATNNTAPFGGMLRNHSPPIVQRKIRAASDTPAGAVAGTSVVSIENTIRSPFPAGVNRDTPPLSMLSSFNKTPLELRSAVSTTTPMQSVPPPIDAPEEMERESPSFSMISASVLGKLDSDHPPDSPLQSPIPPMPTDSIPPPSVTSTSASVDPVSAVIPIHALPTDTATPSPSASLTLSHPPPTPPRVPLRRMSSMERALEDSRRGLTSTTPISSRRKHATKRNNILNTQITKVSINMLTVEDKQASRRESDLADSKYLHRMAKRHSSELVDNLQKKSYKDMNAEFWVTHKWYLACVVCFVTLNVLYTTSFIVSNY